MKNTKWGPLLITLRDRGVDAIALYYSGSGDSGGIDSVCLLSTELSNRNDKGNILIDDFETYNDKEDLNYLFEDPVLANINDEIEDYAYKYIMTGFEDWYNNDGGAGVIVIDTKDGSWQANNVTYYTESETYFHEGNINFED